MTARMRDTEPGAETAPAAALRVLPARQSLGHLLLICGYTVAGVIVTWPTARHLASGQVLKVPDISSYVWALWWMAHQVAHLGNPWFTQYMAAPVGIQLGFDTLMPLPGLIMTPVTLLFGPGPSFTVLTIAMPGLLCYVAYRAARLWLGQPGAIAAGAFFGLSTMLTWQDLYHLNIAIGTLFLPLTLEAAIRLRRHPGRRQGIILGLVLGGSVLTNQESAVVAALLAVAILLPWLARLAWQAGPGHPAGPAGPGEPGFPGGLAALRTLFLAAGVAVVVAGPQLVAMIRQAAAGGAAVGAQQLIQTYREYGVGLPTMFSPSPRLGHFSVGGYHLMHLITAYHYGDPAEGVPTFGLVLTLLAVAGMALTWRRRQSWWLAALWVAGAVLALGPTLRIGSTTEIPLAGRWHDVTVSLLMPYTWLVRVPGLSALREADRLALLGLLGAAILAGTAVHVLCAHASRADASRAHASRGLATAAIVVIAVAGSLEAGWSAARAPTMPTVMATIDAGIAADPSHAIVVDVPFGLRGGVGLTGFKMQPESLILATNDGHPRAISYTSWVPRPTRAGILSNPFYRCLYKAQNGIHHACDAAQLAQVMTSLRRGPKIGWVVVWHSRQRAARPTIISYLHATGFHIDYRVNTPGVDVSVWHR
ncbi:MAG: hypothetical protein ACRDNZ_06680 [Streptosporangiaceae bacterium]